MAPKKIGRYEIKSELGRGGMATVYLAHDPNIGRDVAVKILPRQFLHDPTFRGRFEREARTIAGLEHPAIVPVYDFGEEGEQPFIVMRYMAGKSLVEKMQSGTLTMEQISEILRRIGGALDYAHSKGIIHRDLKPGNILFDQQGNAFLTDFGIARLAESTSTFTGNNIIGTPAYMSPEQIRGEKDLDGRSDLYALGVILFEMLAGRSPYDANTPAKIMMKHVLDPIPHITQFKPDLAPSYDSVLNKALAKDRGKRYETAEALAKDLNLVVTGEFQKPPDLVGTPPDLAGTMIETPTEPIEHTMIETPERPSKPSSKSQPPPATAPAAYEATQIESPPQQAARPIPPAEPVQESRRRLPVMGIVLGGLAILFCLALIIGGGAFALSNDLFSDDEPTEVVVAGDPTEETETAEPIQATEPGATEPVETDTPEPPTEEPTDTPTPTPTKVTLSFVQIEDSTGRIASEFPDNWETVSEELAVSGSTDQISWSEGTSGGEVTVAGITIVVLDDPDPVNEDLLAGLIEEYDPPSNCDFESDNREVYENDPYTGYSVESECDDGRFILFLFYDAGHPYSLVQIEVFVPEGETDEFLTNLLDTFELAPVDLADLEPTLAPSPTTAPQPTAVTNPPTPAPPPPSSTTKDELLAQMRETQSDMQQMGGMIDNAVATGFINCQDVVNTYDRVAAAPTFDVANSSSAVQSAHGSYRRAISIFLQGTAEITDNCRGIIAGSGGSIPFSQWGPARTAVNNALDEINPAIERLESS